MAQEVTGRVGTEAIVKKSQDVFRLQGERSTEEDYLALLAYLSPTATTVDMTNWMQTNYEDRYTTLVDVPSDFYTTARTNQVTSMKGALKGCSSLRRVPIEIDTRTVADISELFAGCSSLEDTLPWAINLESIASVEGIQDMFVDSSIKHVVFVNVMQDILPYLTPEVLGAQIESIRVGRNWKKVPQNLGLTIKEG